MNEVARQLLFPEMNHSWVSMGTDPLVEPNARGFNIKLDGRYTEEDLKNIFVALHQANWKVIRLKYRTDVSTGKTRTTIVLSEWFNTGKQDVRISTIGTAIVPGDCREPTDQMLVAPSEPVL
jgi:hypothetical protein